MSITILHNPRCSKSRQTLALLQENGIQPLVREYLKDPLNTAEISELLAKLGLEAKSLVRPKEDDFKLAGLDLKTSSEAAFIEAMAMHPKLMERPVVIHNDRARIGRPPECVLEIL